MPRPTHPIKTPQRASQPPANNLPAGRVRYRKRLEEVRDLIEETRHFLMGESGHDNPNRPDLLSLSRAVEVLASICQELADEVDLARREKA